MALFITAYGFYMSRHGSETSERFLWKRKESSWRLDKESSRFCLNPFFLFFLNLSLQKSVDLFFSGGGCDM
uniref:Uncharacterized protein n=1 Tax=Noccaea caerulescens TaxID=107243 RepID=A0A1J3CGY4_NOCCA